MKFIVISKLAPGVDNARQSIAAFEKSGIPAGTEGFASFDGKTFINIIDTDTADATMVYTYAPFFEERTVYEVVPVDESWHQAIHKASTYWD